MAADNMRLRVVLDLVERVVAPLKRISTGSTDAAKSLKATRDRLKELNQQQAMVGDWRTLRAGLADTAAKLTEAQAKVAQLARTLHANGPPTRAMERDFARARREAESLGQQHERQAQQVQQLREKLRAAGISTRDMSTHERGLRQNIAATTAEIGRQNAALRAQADHQRKLAKLREQHGKEMLHMGMMAGGGAAIKAGGYKIAEPLRAVTNAFMPAEVSESQLSASMMRSDGSVGPEFKQILELATRLGDKLPGTTADFIDMMTMLRRQGMTSQAILGGLGESAAYLGIQLRMPVTAAAEFAAKMQDATQTAEGDMMGLMDVIQRSFYLGVDPTNMLQGFTKMAAVMPFLGKKGLEASNMLAPMLVMMDQAGMSGESAGNAIRKVVQLSLDAEKLGKANKLLAPDGVKLQFATAGGKFAGFDNLFQQLQKLKGVDSDVKRIAAMKKLFGDDAETHQVLNTLMEKGIEGYREVVQKMEQQADLRKRVDAQLKTVTAAAEAAQGSFTNMLKDMGATIAPDLVKLLGLLGDIAGKTGEWVRENQQVVQWGLRIIAIVSALAVGIGALGIALASILGPMLLARFGLRLLLSMLPGTAAATGAAAAGMGLLYRVGFALGRAFALLRMGAVWLLSGLRVLAMFMIANPIIAALLLMATAAYMVWRNWDGIKGGLLTIWQQLGEAAGAMWDKASAGAAALWQTLLNAKNQFFQAGSDLMQGLVDGITSRAMAVRDAVAGMADAVGAWFREKLGIASPSRVFMQYGGWIAEGAAIGMQGGHGAVRTAALALATTATAAAPGMAGQGPVRFDSRPPLQAAAPQAPAPVAAGATYSITINPAPGMDPQAIARAVSAELDRRERAKRSRVLSQLSDID